MGGEAICDILDSGKVRLNLQPNDSEQPLPLGAADRAREEGSGPN